MNKHFLYCVIATTLLTSSCKSDSDDGTCSALKACGGAVVGTWDATGICFTSETQEMFKALTASALGMAGDACKNAFKSVAVSPRMLTTTFTDTQVTLSGGVAVDLPMHISSACFDSLAMVKGLLSEGTCALLGPAILEGSKTDPDNKIESATCKFAGGNCDCKLLSVYPLDDSNAYMLKDSAFVTTDGDSTPYCVEGTTLKIALQDDAGKESGTMTLKKR